MQCLNSAKEVTLIIKLKQGSCGIERFNIQCNASTIAPCMLHTIGYGMALIDA